MKQKKSQIGIEKLKEVSDDEQVKKLLEKIRDLKTGEQIELTVSITTNNLVWQDQCLFTFDTCRCGNKHHNVISIVRDLLQKHYPEEKWTRKKVEPLIDFK